MNFRSHDDLVQLVRRKEPTLPREIELVVFVPRSGILPAAQIALRRNLPLVSLEDFLAGKSECTRFSTRLRNSDFRGIGRVLVVDDSAGSGLTLAKVRSAIAASGVWPVEQVDYLCVYWSGRQIPSLGYWFERVPFPRVFEWNLFHHEVIESACVDLDGVLCSDPVVTDNDDGARYQEFMRSAMLLVKPTRSIGWIVTSRLEKHRSATEDWLAHHGIRFRELVMLGNVSARARQRSGAHGHFKGKFYQASQAEVFVESDPFQAYEIAQIAGKSVVCTANWCAYHPEMNRLSHYNVKGKRLLERSFGFIARRLGAQR